MKMSSHGTIVARQNVVVSNEEDNNTSTEELYSFVPQSEIYNPKMVARSKHQQKQRSTRKEKNKQLRKQGKPVPKSLPKPKNGLIKPYEHQSLGEYLYPSAIIDQARESLAQLGEPENSSQLLDVFETLGLLSFTLPKCKSAKEVAAQLALALKTMVNGSLIETAVSSSGVIEWCMSTFGYNIFMPQAGDEETNSSWLDLLPKIKENWEVVRGAPVFEKISNLISMAVSIGLCSATKLKWSVKGIELFRATVMKKHVSAMDFVGAVLDTVVVFIEGGYECWRQKSFTPLLFSNEDGRKFDSLYFTLIELHEHAMIFNLATKPIEYNGEKRPITDLEYGSLLDEAIAMAERAFKSAKGTWQQSVLEKRLTVLRTNRALYNAKRIDGSMRQAPFTIFIWGESGVGKSTVAQVVMADCLRAAGANPDPQYTAIIKESDKYDSTLKGDTAGIFLDDMGNTRAEFLDKSPTERLIDINNNMITYANKADLHEKGKIEVRPRVLVVTSNAPLITHAKTGSIHPYSIVRRGDVHICVKVKPEFAMPDGRLDSYKCMSTFPDSSLVTDVWNLEVYVPDENNKNLNLRPAFGDGINMRPSSINKSLEFLTDKCQKHFEIQRRIVEKGQGLVEARNYCSKCNRASELCKCEMENQAILERSFESIRSQMQQMNGLLNNIAVRIPTCVVSAPIVQKAYMMYNFSDFLDLERQSRRNASSAFMLLVGFLCASDNCSVLTCGTVFLLCVGVYLSTIAAWRDDMCTRLANSRTITRDLFASLRQSKAVQFFSFCVVGRIIYNCVKFTKTLHQTQSALAPTSADEIKKRDAEVNPWANPVVAELHISSKNKNMTHDQVVAKVSQNLFHATLTENNFQQSCDITALGGTLYLLPLHVFANRKDMSVVVTKDDPDNLNSQFRGFVSVAAMTPIPGRDACIVNIPSGGPMADITHLFPDTTTVTGSAHLMYRRSDGHLMSDVIRANWTRDSEAGGPGYQYQAPYNTFSGMCGAVLVSEFAKSSIVGIHLRGISDTPHGKALTITRAEIMEAIRKCDSWVGTMPSHVNGDFPVSRYERQVVTSQDIHPKSPINFLPVGSNVEYLGQNPGRVTHTKSEVIRTPISNLVEEETGVPNKHGPPAFHTWKMWQVSLAHSANPGRGVEPTLVDRAVLDYCGELIDTLQDDQFKGMIHAELKPLTEMETLCGRDGARFIDAMKRSTSKGFPLSGPKSEWIYLLDPEDYPTHACPAKCDAQITDEFNVMVNKLRNGERCYAIFKACVKDEPTKLGKDKVRVFQAADWAFQLIVRKYFLPIARVLSLFPLASECAVGVNAQGPEWDDLAKHMRKFGCDRILAGDYSKYDLRMPAGLIIAAFKCMINVAQKCGQYTDEDITIMKGVCTEVAFSCVAYNGDIIIHRGSNPSGQNLTVYVNCIVNSLLLRCAYYHLHPTDGPAPTPFRQNVAVMTYGDDVKGSVREGYDWFNHMTYAAFLKERDMVFTMPDKESEPTPYMTDDDADFLKRHNHYSEHTGYIHGVLDEASIFKSLHTVLKSKAISPLDQSAMNIDGALREWWQYGPEMYEKRRQQMNRVAERAGITHMCTELDVSFESRLAMFREKYEFDNNKMSTFA